MTIKMSDCDAVRLERMLAGTATEAEELALERHLDECAGCRDELDRLAAAPRVWRDARQFLSDPEASPVAEDRSGDESAASVEFDDEAPSEREVRSDEHAASIAVVLRSLAPSDDPDSLGRLGGYEITGVVGAGGMGVVLKGFDRSLNRYVALKALAPHLATSGAARKRFAREAQAAAAVVHENVVAIHGVAEDSEPPYFVMPYLRTGSLQKRLDHRGPLEPREILRIALQVARGLAAAHAQGLVHRDIKPANILVSEDVERVQITDFGLARAIDDASLTRTGVIAGTPLYMSPEQARGDAIDGRSDLFSLGSVMYAMCTGRPPFRAETTLAVLRRIGESRPRPIRELNPAIPEWLARLVERLHEKRPERRVESAESLATLLERCLAHLQDPERQELPATLDRWRLPWTRTELPRPTWRGAAFAAVVFGAAFLGSALWFGRADELFQAPSRDDGAAAEEESRGLTDGRLAPDSASNLEAPVRTEWRDGVSEELQELRERAARLERATGAGGESRSGD